MIPMRRPYGPESHATGATLALSLRDGMNTGWSARGTLRMSLSTALDVASDIDHPGIWTEADIAKAFGVRESMVTRSSANVGSAVRWVAELAGGVKGDDREATIVRNARAAQWDLNLYPIKVHVKRLERLQSPPTVTIVDNRR